MILTILILSFVTISYSLIIRSYTLGWLKEKEYVVSENKPKVKVSVIIAARNEEKNIKKCLEHLINQDYPKELYEIIVVDDNSSDSTVDKILNLNNPQIYLIKLSEIQPLKTGKKNAISEGINHATGELIMMTDADCFMGNKWIITVADFYKNTESQMIASPVCFAETKGILKSFQTLEFMSLIASGAGSIIIKRPVMCNSANIAFQRKTFIRIGGYDDGFVSGDDIFLMLNIGKHFGNSSISFLKNRDAIVFTELKENFIEFVNQRIRWVSKTRGYTNFTVLKVASIVFFFNFAILFCLIAGFFKVEALYYYLGMILIKSITDYLLLDSITSFNNRKKLMLYFIPLEFIYSLYVVIITLTGLTMEFNWKGRKIKR